MPLSREDTHNLVFMFSWLEERLRRMERVLLVLVQQGRAEMATIQEILDDENTETGDLAALVTVVHSQQDTIATQTQLIADLQASQGQLTPEQQAQLDAINVTQDENRATIQSLLPPAPPA